MDAEHAKSSRMMSHYEGLVRTTASLCAPYVEEEFDDICQFLRYKVWRALEAFEPSKLRVKVTGTVQIAAARDRYVYSCVQNGKKDVLKKKRHGLLFLEDFLSSDHAGEGYNRRRGFEQRYLSIEDAFRQVEDAIPTVPSTLTESEKAIVLLLYLDFKPAEIAVERGLPRKEITDLVRSIREKMADWNPTTLAARAVAEVAVDVDASESATLVA